MDIDEIRELTPLAGVPAPIYFVSKGIDRWPELANLSDGDDAPAALDAAPDRVVTHEDMTIVQTFVNLRRAGLEVHLVDKVEPGALNVMSSIDLAVSDRTAQAFVVAFRGDWCRPELADVVLTMNPLVATRPNEFYLPHWIQTGLVPRDTSRGTQLSNVVFKGDVVNLDPRFATEEFRRQLRDLDVDFRVQAYDRRTSTSGWHDYAEVDAVLAIRAIAGQELATKPASKLVNAWAAGVPALLGDEAAFRALRQSPLDYIEIGSPGEAIAAVELLKSNSALYAAMVERGSERAKDFTNQNIADRWRGILSGPVFAAYVAWLKMSPRQRDARYLARVARHKVATELFRRQASTRGG